MISVARLYIPVCALCVSINVAVADEEDVAVAILCDTSGSMTQAVKNAAGGREPKFLIANEALRAIVARLEKYTASSKRKVLTGLFTFAGKGSQELVKPGPFDAALLRAAIDKIPKPTSGTPLGTAIDEATHALGKVKAGSRHVLVITDGENTAGPPPEAVLPKLQDEALKSGAPVYFHFVAFDVDARVFAGVKKNGATVVSASDEKQLNDKLAFILEEKILLEKE
jgi:von Willebrand factor type A domain